MHHITIKYLRFYWLVFLWCSKKIINMEQLRACIVSYFIVSKNLISRTASWNHNWLIMGREILGLILFCFRWCFYRYYQQAIRKPSIDYQKDFLFRFANLRFIKNLASKMENVRSVYWICSTLALKIPERHLYVGQLLVVNSFHQKYQS